MAFDKSSNFLTHLENAGFKASRMGLILEAIRRELSPSLSLVHVKFGILKNN